VAILDEKWNSLDTHVFVPSLLYNITDDEPQWLHQDALDQNIVSAICAVYDNQDFRILVADPKGGKPILRTLLLEAGGA